MNSRNNDSFDNFYKRSGNGNSSSSQQRSNGFQISTDNYYHNYEPAVARVEFGSADSYITPPARQLEQLEYKNSWFHPPKKSKKFVKRDLDSSEMQQISKKLNFFDESVTNTSSIRTANTTEAGIQGNDQLDYLTYQQLTSNVSVLSSGTTNQPQQGAQIVSHNSSYCGSNSNKNRSSYNNNTGNNSNINNNQNTINQNYSVQQSNAQYNPNLNNRQNNKYNKAPSNPESILKFR